MNDIKIDGDVEGGNVNIGGTQNFYGDMSIYQLPTKQAPAKRKVRIFISYARDEAEPFVERLYQDLKDEFDVWWDRETMSNRGKTFLQEIRDAIDRADRLLLVAGPSAFTSDYVRYEWQHAYQIGKPINTALRLGKQPKLEENLPEELRSYDTLDFREDTNYDERLGTLKRQLTEPVAPFGAFHYLPALPSHFLGRPDALDALRDLVIADVDKPALISAEVRTTVIEGMGGTGKSVLVTAFAHDRKVRFAFPDGIVWLKVGHTPSMYELYRQVGIALGDDLSNYPDEPTALQNAQKVLAEKRCLLILDDVWEQTVGRNFRDLVSGTLTRLLVTTRDQRINDVLNGNKYPLKLIEETHAVDYLRSWVGDDPHLTMVAEKLDRWFLPLNLAGRLMKENNLTGAEYLSMFERVSDMEIAPNREDSLEISINLGVDAAFAKQDDKKHLYHTFGIFQEGAAVPQQTVLQLWSHLRPDNRPIDHLKTLARLVGLGLVERNDQNIITLHDLLHSYAREKLGDRMMQTHQDLLDSYEVKEWHKLSPDEPYLWRNIAYHLTGAGQHEKLHGLISREFMRAKWKVNGSHSSFARDVAYVIRIIEKGRVNDLPRLMAYNLLYASLGSLATNLWASVLGLLAQWGKVDQAINYAEMIVDPSQRAGAFQAIAQAGLDGHWQAMEERTRQKLQITLLRRSFELAHRIDDYEKRARFLQDLAKKLARAGDRVTAFAAAEAIFQVDSDFYKVKDNIYSELAPEFAVNGNAQDALDTLDFIESNFSKSKALVRIISRFADAGLAKASLNSLLRFQVDMAAYQEEYLQTEFNEDFDYLCDVIARNFAISEEGLRKFISLLREIKDQHEIDKYILEMAKHLDSTRLNRYEQHTQSKSQSGLFTAFIWLAEFDQALELLTRIPKANPFLCAPEIRELAEGLIIAGRIAEARELAARAQSDSWRYDEARTIVYEWEREYAELDNMIRRGRSDEALNVIMGYFEKWKTAKALCILGVALTRAGRLEELVKWYKEYEYDGITYTAELVAYLAREGLFTEAEVFTAEVLESLDFYYRRAFHAIAGALLGRKKDDEILPLARRLFSKTSERCYLLAQLAFSLKPVDSRKADLILEEAIIESETIDDKHDFAGILSEIVHSLRDLGMIDDMCRISETIVEEKTEDWAEVASYLLKSAPTVDDAEQRFTDTLNFLKTISQSTPEEPKRFRVIQQFARALADEELFDLAIRVARLLPEDYHARSWLIEELQIRIGITGTEQDASKLLGHLESPRSVEDNSEEDPFTDHNSWIYYEVALKKASDGQYAVARDILTNAGEYVVNPTIVDFIEIRALLEQKNFEKVQRSVNELLSQYPPNDDYDFWIMILSLLIFAYAQNDRLDETVELIKQIPNYWIRKQDVQQITILAFLNERQHAAATVVASSLKDESWKTFFSRLISLDIGEDEVVGRERPLTWPLAKILSMTQLIWNMSNGLSLPHVERLLALIVASKFEDILTAISDAETDYYGQLRLKSSIAKCLVRAGMFERASRILDEITDSNFVTSTVRAIAEIVSAQSDQEAMNTIAYLLEYVRTRGRTLTCIAISELIKYVPDLVGQDLAPEMMLEIHRELTRVDNFWELTTE